MWVSEPWRTYSVNLVSYFSRSVRTLFNKLFAYLYPKCLLLLQKSTGYGPTPSHAIGTQTSERNVEESFKRFLVQGICHKISETENYGSGHSHNRTGTVREREWMVLELIRYWNLEDDWNLAHDCNLMNDRNIAVKTMA